MAARSRPNPCSPTCGGCADNDAMLRLTADDVRLGVRARDKTEAIRAAGALLAQRGYSAPDYVASMLGREAQSNTFLGRGATQAYQPGSPAVKGPRSVRMRARMAAMRIAPAA